MIKNPFTAEKDTGTLPRHAQPEYDKRDKALRFERLMSDLMARFINVGPEQLDAEIESALQKVLDFFQVDRCGLLGTTPDGKGVHVTHAAYSEGMEHVSGEIDLAALYPWSYEQLVQGKAVRFGDVGELPESAERDKEVYIAWGILSGLDIPLFFAGRLSCIIVLNSVRKHRAWPEEYIPRLRLLGEIFLNALEHRKTDRALREGKARLGLATEAAGAMPWELDISTGNIWTTEHGRDFFGFAPESRMTIESFLRVVHPEDRETLRLKVEEAIQSGQDSKVEYRIVRPGGSIRWIKSRGRLYPEAGTGLTRLMGVSMDITGSKLAEAAHEESQVQALAVVNSTDDFIWSVDPERFGLLTWNTAFRDYFFRNRGIELAVGMTPEDLVPPEFVALWRELFSRALREGSFRTEYTVVAQTNVLLLSLNTLKRGSSVFGISVFGKDITELKKAEAARLESAAQQRAVVEAFDGLIYICSQDYRIEFMNERLIERTGRNAVGEPCYRVLHDRDSVCPWCENARVFRGETVRWEVQSPKDHRWYYVVNTPVRHADGTLSKQAMIMDITERKKAEESLKESYAEIARLKEKLEAENVYLREEVSLSQDGGRIIGASDPIKYVLYRINQVAPMETTVLVVGETGTGKGLVARAIHEASSRRDRPMVSVNCAVLPSNLIESELFGREKGAFTGAQARQIGRFELADKGTIFLDEIAELPVELQAKLLRVVEDGEFERLGDPRSIKVDVRIIASTNRDLEEEIRKGRFREDLFYRLNVFPITVPPLRERTEDIPLIVDVLIKRLNKQLGRRISTVPREVMKALQHHSWPGNVRELENIIERAVIMSPGPELQLTDQLGALSQHATVVHDAASPELAEVERAHIRKTLEALKWRVEGPRGAAHALGMKPSTLRDRMQKLDIRRPKTF